MKNSNNQNEMETTTTKTPTKPTKVVKENVKETTIEKIPTKRIPKIDKVKDELCNQFKIDNENFWKFVAIHKPSKMSLNKFADSIVHDSFFNRQKLIEKLTK